MVDIYLPFKQVEKKYNVYGKLSFYHKYTIHSSDGYRGRLFGIPSTYPSTTSIVVFYIVLLFGPFLATVRPACIPVLLFLLPLKSVVLSSGV